MAGEHSPSDILRKMRRKLINIFKEQPNVILDELDATLIITKDEYNEIDEIAGPTERIRKLINTVVQKGEETCERFWEVLQNLQSEIPELDEILSEFYAATRGESCPTNVNGTPAAEGPLLNQEQNRIGTEGESCPTNVNGTPAAEGPLLNQEQNRIGKEGTSFNELCEQQTTIYSVD